MLRIGVMVSGGGTNLQAIMDAMDSGRITNTELAVVISNNANAYALERARQAHGVIRRRDAGEKYQHAADRRDAQRIPEREPVHSLTSFWHRQDKCPACANRQICVLCDF